ncbi:serine hydroxymethyltransferase [Halobacteriales archaeon QS_8_69_26]|nr:MAG: serine hydroxymethyltransferase [Halobacteriales archaeon QS_8_69_26]
MSFDESFSEADPAVAEAVAAERDRQESTLMMIASENHAPPAVLAAQGTALTNKYAEGYPGERYYAGCQHVDEIEQLAIDRAKELFGADHANVQPHSGTQANMGVYFAVLEPGDRILSLSLSHGGHLSHGHSANFSGNLYDVEQYEVEADTGYIDYDSLAAHAREFDPDMIVSGSSAYPREFEFDRVGAVADEVGAYHLADIAHITGLVATGLHANPVEHADFVTGSTHKTVRSGRGGLILCDEAYTDDVDAAVFPGSQGGPLLHNVAGKAVGFKKALEPEFEEYTRRIVDGATALAETLSGHGVAPVSGGTDKHFVLVDLRESHPDLTGAEAEDALEEAGIVVNKNTVPGETRSPFVTSGIRIGTPALATRGMDTEELETVGELIVRVLDAPDDERTVESVRGAVRDLCEEYPVYDS